MARLAALIVSLALFSAFFGANAQSGPSGDVQKVFKKLIKHIQAVDTNFECSANCTKPVLKTIGKLVGSWPFTAKVCERIDRAQDCLENCPDGLMKGYVEWFLDSLVPACTDEALADYDCLNRSWIGMNEQCFLQQCPLNFDNSSKDLGVLLTAYCNGVCDALNCTATCVYQGFVDAGCNADVAGDIRDAAFDNHRDFINYLDASGLMTDFPNKCEWLVINGSYRKKVAAMMHFELMNGLMIKF